MGSITVGGVVRDVPGLDCEWGPALGLTWRVGQCRVSARTQPVRLGVVHATGGEGRGDDFRRIYDVLTRRGYSVHFAVGDSGRVVQYLDPALHVAAHVGGLNVASVGIEVENPMYPFRQLGERAASEGIVQVVSRVPGPLPGDFTTRHGARLYWRRSWRRPCLGLTPGQAASMKLLARALSDALGVPWQRADARDYVPHAERARLRGWLGHAQVTLGHGDPSLDSLDGLFAG